MSTFMRTEAEPEIWRHVMVWFLPAQIMRGLLMAVALFPFLDTLAGWNLAKRFPAIAGVYLIFGFWVSTVAVPGTIEGLVYLRPKFTFSVHLTVQPEIIVQVSVNEYLARLLGSPLPAPAMKLGLKSIAR